VNHITNGFWVGFAARWRQWVTFLVTFVGSEWWVKVGSEEGVLLTPGEGSNFSEKGSEEGFLLTPRQRVFQKGCGPSKLTAIDKTPDSDT